MKLTGHDNLMFYNEQLFVSPVTDRVFYRLAEGILTISPHASTAITNHLIAWSEQPSVPDLHHSSEKEEQA
jgi:hypothetical protein